MLAQNIWLWAQVGALAFFASLAASGFMCIAGLGDASDGRSAHSGVVPTSGGLGIITSFGLALCGVALLFPSLKLGIGFAPVMALLFAVGFLGLVDDAMTLGPKLKFGVMLVICGAAVWSIGPPVTLPFLDRPIPLHPAIGFGGAVLWIFVVMNAVNFMDGANGLMGLTMTIANFALFGVGLISGSPTTLLLSALALMALLGFLPYNLRQEARVFSGDVGSLSIGFLFAVTILFLIAETPGRTFHLVGPILILPLLVDVLLTLVRRVRKRENILQAHNTHLYQRLIRSGRGHLAVSGFYALAALICANIVVIGAAKSWFDRIHVPLMLLGASVTAYILISRGLDSRRPNH
jgi:UDP-GlcNAc:undecaprenyl-phosphate GlcNAc-1-phosphate transferase